MQLSTIYQDFLKELFNDNFSFRIFHLTEEFVV